MLALVNRPSAADSPCAVPNHHAILEMGYGYYKISHSAYANNVPQAQFRLGLPSNNEFTWVAPTYITQTSSASGFSYTLLGFKHEIGYTEHWLGAVDGYVIPPSGSDVFGSQGWGGVLNAIVNYSINETVSCLFQLGVSSQTLSAQAGGQRYSSVNPDFILSWQPQERMSVYGEIYGQSKTAPNAGAGFNMDVGFLYLVTHSLDLDLVVGQRISGQLGDIDHYVGAGLGLLF